MEDSESIYILKQCVNPPLACNPVHRESPFITQAAFPTVRERQLESAIPSNLVVVSRVASSPLSWVQWLSGKSVRLAIGSFGAQLSRFRAGSLWIFYAIFVQRRTEMQIVT